MLALTIAPLSYTAPALPAMAPMRATTPAMATFQDFVDSPVADTTLEKPWTSDEISDAAGLEGLAEKLNPIVGYWDPLNIGSTSKENIAWFRHAEIKHGRVAMAGFVGWIVQSSGAHWPWNLQGFPGTGSTPISFGDISAAGGPADQWDALPSAAKVQIICGVGILELFSESSVFLEAEGQKHYVRGGTPGYFPRNLKAYAPHPIPLNFWDPLGFTKKMTPEKKQASLLAEINNGRLAMLGIFGLVSASKGLIVPGLDSLGLTPYSGEFMAPFKANNADLPFVQAMLDLRGEQIAREAAILGDAYLNNGS